MLGSRISLRAPRLPAAAGLLALMLFAVGSSWFATPAFADTQTYALGPGATITYVVPTTSAPVTVTGSDSISGSFSLAHQQSSPFSGGDFFTVTGMSLQTGSGAAFALKNVASSQDPVLADTGVPGSYDVDFTQYGTADFNAVLAGSGIAPSSGYAGFTIQQTGLAPELPTFSGSSTSPTGFDLTVSHSLTPPGLGLYEYTTPKCNPSGCSTTLALFAMIDGTAGAINPPSSKVNMRFHYAADGSTGGWSSSQTVSPLGAITIGPQATEGSLVVNPGDTLSAGYDFDMPGSHPAATLGFSNTTVTFQAACSSGSGGGQIVVHVPNEQYTDPLNVISWQPSGNQQDPSVYQGQTTVPDLCHGGSISLKQGGTFNSTVGQL